MAKEKTVFLVRVFSSIFPIKDPIPMFVIDRPTEEEALDYLEKDEQFRVIRSKPIGIWFKLSNGVEKLCNLQEMSLRY